MKDAGGFRVELASGKAISMADLVVNFSKETVTATVDGHPGTALLSLVGTPKVTVGGSRMVVTGLRASVAKSGPLASFGGGFITAVGALRTVAR